MKIEDFKQLTTLEPVILHTDNGRTGNKRRRLTVAAVVADGELLIAKAECSKDDQFRKDVGVSKSLGRLTTLIKSIKNGHARLKLYIRYPGTLDACKYPQKYDRKQVLQVIDYIK